MPVIGACLMRPADQQAFRLSRIIAGQAARERRAFSAGIDQLAPIARLDRGSLGNHINHTPMRCSVARHTLM